MTTFPCVLDNERAAVAEQLRRNLAEATAFDFVSAYFTIYGYELLAAELENRQFRLYHRGLAGGFNGRNPLNFP